jgi:[acyl-carrier-protein] S-malonyltransferase
VERLIVSPAAGVFCPEASIASGTQISAGQCIGAVGAFEVYSAFSGVFQAFIAVDGERVTSRQPIAWLRTN